MLPRLADYAEAALDLIFPPMCVGCGREGELVCDSCLRLLPRINPPVCPRCGRPETNGIICPACTVWKAQIDGVRSPFRFEGTIRAAIHQFKYRNVRALAAPLGLLLAQYYLRNPIPADVLIPVPLHRRRLKERGYNQSKLLADKVGSVLGLPITEKCVARHRYATQQARTKSVKERLRNVENAFHCPQGDLKGCRVLLIDDVATTGATLDACASALKSAGAGSVWALVLAREL